MEKAITKHYSNGEVTIIWQPKLCIHSGICAKGLPNVFQPKERPWIKIDAATTQQLVEQVAHCPTGALSSSMNVNEKQQEDISTKKASENQPVKAVLIKNGPLMLHSDVEITDAAGNSTIKEKMAAFCRCGASNNKPFCDGSHTKSGFEG